MYEYFALHLGIFKSNIFFYHKIIDICREDNQFYLGLCKCHLTEWKWLRCSLNQRGKE